MTQRISLGDKAANFNWEENKSALQPLYGARLKNFSTTASAASMLDKHRNVEEKTKQEKSQERVQDKSMDKSKEKVLEKMQENILEKRTQGLIRVAKQPQVEKEEMEKLPVAAKQLQIEQEKSKGLVLNLGHCEEKTGKPHTPISVTRRCEMTEKTEPPKPGGTTYSRNDLQSKYSV